MKRFSKKAMVAALLAVLLPLGCKGDKTGPAAPPGFQGGGGLASGNAIPPDLFLILQEYHCANCHNPSTAGSGITDGSFMDLRTPQSVYAEWVGTDAEASPGTRVKPYESQNSVLMVRLQGGTFLIQMPLDGPPYLEPSEIAQFRAWIDAGAPPAE